MLCADTEEYFMPSVLVGNYSCCDCYNITMRNKLIKNKKELVKRKIIQKGSSKIFIYKCKKS